jgi:Arc/MetJ-type ribon-helix-helix transcriptional regulator
LRELGVFSAVSHLTIVIELCYLAVVKTVTKSISLNEELANFANRQAEQGCYGNVSAYFADLLRKARQEQMDQDLKLLADGVKDAGPEPPDDQVVAPIKAIRRRMQREKWKPS